MKEMVGDASERIELKLLRRRVGVEDSSIGYWVKEQNWDCGLGFSLEHWVESFGSNACGRNS